MKKDGWTDRQMKILANRMMYVTCRRNWLDWKSWEAACRRNPAVDWGTQGSACVWCRWGREVTGGSARLRFGWLPSLLMRSRRGERAPRRIKGSCGWLGVGRMRSGRHRWEDCELDHLLGCPRKSFPVKIWDVRKKAGPEILWGKTSECSHS